MNTTDKGLLPVEQRHKKFAEEAYQLDWDGNHASYEYRLAEIFARFERDHLSTRTPSKETEGAVAWMYERNGCYVLKKNRTPEYTTPVMGHAEIPLYASPPAPAEALREEVERLRLVHRAAREFVECYDDPDGPAFVRLDALRAALRQPTPRGDGEEG